MELQSHVDDLISRADKLALAGDVNGAFETLRATGLDVFGYVLAEHSRDPRYPGLSSILPAYPDEEIQRGWTGNSGEKLLAKTVDFVRTAGLAYQTFLGSRLRDKLILDYGCGWSRILRQMYYFSNPDRVFGVDPWDRSLTVSRSLGIRSVLASIDYLPRTLPFNFDFDLFYAFSVFTHISAENSEAILNACRVRASSSSMFIGTIRPVEYWLHRTDVLGAKTVAEFSRKHLAGEYVFHPAQKLSSTDHVYGESSVAVNAFTNLANQTGWRLVGSERLLVDPLQVLVFLTPC